MVAIDIIRTTVTDYFGAIAQVEHPCTNGLACAAEVQCAAIDRDGFGRGVVIYVIGYIVTRKTQRCSGVHGGINCKPLVIITADC